MTFIFTSLHSAVSNPEKKLPVYECFNADSEARNQRETAEIVIIDDHDRTPILSSDTAYALKVIEIGYDVG